MLHNTGPYGPNETPVNMGAPMNISQLSTPINMVQNLNNMSKMPQQSPPAATGHYNLPNYPSYGNPPLNVSPQMHPFQNYHPLGFQPSYMPQNTSLMQNAGWQNAMLPMSLNMHGDHSPNILNYPHLDKRLPDPVNSYKDLQNLAKTPLNIPQIPNKPFQKEPEPVDYVSNTYNDHYKPYVGHNEGLNLGLSLKSPESLLSDNTRRKNLENTVRLIENILINTTKNREMQQSMETNHHIEKNHQNSYRDEETSLSRKDLTSNISGDDSDDNDDEMDNVPVKFDDNDEIDNNPNYSDDESYKSDENSQNENNDNADSCNNKITVTVEVPVNPGATGDDEESRKTKCVEIDLKTVIKEEPVEQIVVKIEQVSSWTDTEHANPFHRDSNGVMREDAVHENIIDADTSEIEAMEVIKNGVTSSCYFECPQCCLLFEHPKRFLIHIKWHTFGHDKRAEVITKKTERERKEAQKRIKLEGSDDPLEENEVKPGTVSTSKVWPCKDCDKVYYAKSSLSGHRQRYHSNRIRECKICSKVVAGWSAWKAHQATHNTESGFQCNICPKKFKYAHSLAKHKDTHLEKTHACPECPKKFGSQVLLKVHMKSHERAKLGASFHCSFCGKAFYDKFNMQIHERTHTNERPFVCEICNATFGCNSNLSRHLKVSHSSSKPHVCGTCNRSFVSELIRDRHQMRVHGDPEDFKYTCKICPSRYMKQVDLRKHTYKMHPKPKSETKTK